MLKPWSASGKAKPLDIWEIISIFNPFWSYKKAAPVAVLLLLPTSASSLAIAHRCIAFTWRVVEWWGELCCSYPPFCLHHKHGQLTVSWLLQSFFFFFSLFLSWVDLSFFLGQPVSACVAINVRGAFGTQLDLIGLLGGADKHQQGLINQALQVLLISSPSKSHKHRSQGFPNWGHLESW